jgi:hypothetical protein
MNIEFKETEVIYSNRAFAYINLQEYKLSIVDCNKAIAINSLFAKAHKRLSKSLLSIGKLEVIN